MNPAVDEKTQSTNPQSVDSLVEGTSPEMEIAQVLQLEHAHIRRLFSELLAAENLEQMQSLFLQVYRELLVHEQAEEVACYQTVKAFEGMAQAVERALSEHADIQSKLEDLRNTPPSSSEFKAKVHQLRESVEKHVDTEEGYIFPRMRVKADSSFFRALSNDFFHAKTTLFEALMESGPGEQMAS